MNLFVTFVKPLSLVRKFFTLDKNYLLEEAQLLSQDRLLSGLIEKVKTQYESLYNPLGLADPLTLQIRNYRPRNLKPLGAFYQNLAGVYRYKHGENQLEFLWDGLDHLEKYKSDWSAFFTAWTNRFCSSELFIRAVLDLTVFLPENRNAQLAESRMNHFIMEHLEVRIDKERGILGMRMA